MKVYKKLKQSLLNPQEFWGIQNKIKRFYLTIKDKTLKKPFINCKVNIKYGLPKCQNKRL